MSGLTIAIVGMSVLSFVQNAPPPVPPPVPKPFPGAVQSPPDAKTPGGKTEKPTTAPAPKPAINAQPGNTPIHPRAELLDAFDAGQGQQYIIYGTDVPYATVVDYYKQLLKSGGTELFRTPAMHRFDLGRFDENTMAYPPSIVVKDYTWNGSPGYLHVDGSTEKRYRTIIQVVPVK
jgi:hypothetical protein